MGRLFENQTSMPRILGKFRKFMVAFMQKGNNRKTTVILNILHTFNAPYYF